MYDMDGNALTALALTFVAGGATAVGAGITFFLKKDDFKILALGMSFSAGVMIYLSFMDILPMSFENMAVGGVGERTGEIAAVAIFFVGAFLTALIDWLVPEHIGSDSVESPRTPSVKAHRAAVLTAAALAVHNFPEGLSVFVSGLENITVGASVALAITIHNIPEGVSVALPIYSATGNKKRAFLWASLSGMAEPLGALVAYLFLYPFLSPQLTGGALALTAGVMVYISLDELLPMAKEYGEEHYGIIGVFAGMALMAAVGIFFN